MNKEQLERKIVELREHVFALQKKIDETEREICEMKDDSKWPRVYDIFFFVTISGVITSAKWRGDSLQTGMKAIGNCFCTEDDARYAAERLKVLAELRKYACEPDWSKVSTPKYVLVYNRSRGQIGEDIMTSYYHGGFVFETEDALKRCINEIGEERLKKYYFGVK